MQAVCLHAANSLPIPLQLQVDVCEPVQLESLQLKQRFGVLTEQCGARPVTHPEADLEGDAPSSDAKQLCGQVRNQ